MTNEYNREHFEEKFGMDIGANQAEQLIEYTAGVLGVTFEKARKILKKGFGSNI